MQRSQRDFDLDYPVGKRILVEGPWSVFEMIFTKERTEWLWKRIKEYPSLTTDPTRGDPNQLWRVVSSPQALWFEVWKDSQIIGVLYMSQIQAGVDAYVHPIFFDRQFTDKAPVCLAMLRWAQKEFSLHRITAVMPDVYFATARLAKRLGFKPEGIRRQAYIIRGRWCNELIFGLLASELV